MNINYSVFSPDNDDPIIEVHNAERIDRDIPYHHAKGAGFIFEYILSGEACIESPDFLVKARIGDFIIIRPDVECVIYKNSATLSSISLNISGFVLDAAAEVVNIGNIFHASVDMLDRFLRILSLYEKYKAGDGKAGKKICTIAFSLILDAAALKSVPDVDNERPSAEKIRNYLDLCLCGDVDLDSIGSRFGITGMHVIRLFRAEYDTTPMQYLKIRRIEKAALLLTRSKLSIKEVSTMLRFSSTQHFTNLFREHFGVSPGKFRENSRKL